MNRKIVQHMALYFSIHIFSSYTSAYPLEIRLYFTRGLGHLFLRAWTCHSIRCREWERDFTILYECIYGFFFSWSSRHTMRFWELLCEMKTDQSYFCMWHSKLSSQFSSMHQFVFFQILLLQKKKFNTKKYKNVCIKLKSRNKIDCLHDVEIYRVDFSKNQKS